MQAISLSTEPPAGITPQQLAAAATQVNAWPVIVREMRSEARNRSNYWLRLLGAAGLTVLFVVVLTNETRPSVTLSSTLFSAGHTVLLLVIGLIGPALTSDAISFEARSGTLSLLFVTNLTARAVVLGKGCVHMVRLMTLWLAAVPILMMPVLFGGVRWLDIGSAFGLELSVALWALGAGLVASSLFKHPIPALLVAEILFYGLLWVLRLFLGFACLLQLSPFLNLGTMQFSSFSLLLDEPLLFLTGFPNEGGWSGKLAILGLRGDHIWLCILAETLLFSMLGFILLLSLASWRAGQIWQEQPLSLRQWRRQQRWLRPRFWLSNFAVVKNHWLERNPLGWLQRHSTWTRVSELSWFALILLVESLVVLDPHPWEKYALAQTWLAMLLSVQMTFTAVMTFRKERESGLLELLLVAPITVEQVISRQLQGFWQRFFAPVALLLGLAYLIVWLDMASFYGFHLWSFLLVNYVTTPLIGFYAAARFRNFAAAFFFTAFFSLALPLCGPELAVGFLSRLGALDFWFMALWPEPPSTSQVLDWAIKLCQAAVAVLLGYRLWASLERRTFYIDR